jgi:dipeptidyl aminopeptidase/acylaminoacyl peptidase
LTVPLASGPRPLIVMPHGGPEARDDYDFDFIAQAFAAQGWMVLKVNFRGSGGYGRRFTEAGYHHWGDLMQQDTEDATDQVLASGRVDPKKVAVWGWSYGGYSALMQAVRRPDFYTCAVSGAGISNLYDLLSEEQQKDTDNINYNYLLKFVGDPVKNKDLYDAGSAVKQVAKIKIPILLLHGTKDVTVDPEQSKEMRDALQRAGKPVTYVELKDAAHHENEWGPKNLKIILQTSVDFIAKSFA